MENYELTNRMPTVEELEELRKLVNWGVPERYALELGLRNSLFGVCAVADNKTIGTIRIVGDRSTCFYIQDVIVNPEYQKQGIGSAMMKVIMNYIAEHACEGAVIGLMSAKGKEEFYEKFGFWKRPNENFGHGMIQFWRKG